MVDIVLFTTPFDASKTETFQIEPGTTIARFLFASELDKRMQREPIVVRVNGDEITSAQYDYVLDEFDIVTLHVLPQGGVGQLIAYVVVALAVKYYVDSQLDNVEDSDDASPTYDINARGNQARLGSPKPVFYGTMRSYPDLGAIPYTEYDANGDQILYQLFEVRQGEADINIADLRFEDTPVVNFEGYEIEIIEPGDRSALFPGPVVVSTELESNEIGPTPNDFGDYKDIHTGVDSPPDAAYVVCDIGQQVTRVSMDVVADAGIYRVNPEGKLRYRAVTFRFEARKINDAGAPIGSWFTLANEALASNPDNYRGAVRRTFTYPIDAGRYEIRTVRTTTKSDNSNVNDVLKWVGLRGFLAETLPVTTTTRIALKIRASEQLGRRGATKFNVISTGKIPTWNPSTGWGAPVVTANPAWVFADILHNTIYGAGRGDAFIDLPGLYALATQLDAAEIEFHGGFDTATTVWDALTKVAAVAQAKPVDRGGVYYMVRDVQASAPAYMFSHANIVKDSFRLDYSGVLEETADAYRLLFLDKDQDYRETDIICALPGSAEEKIKDIKIFGVVDKDQVFDWGMYMAASSYYRRRRVEFQTGIEGYLPFYYDTVSVSHYLIGREGQDQVSGDVIAFDGVNRLTLSENVDHLTTPYIVLRNLDGSPTEPYLISVISSNVVQIAEAFDASGLVFDAGYERPHFMCGEGEHFFARVKIDTIKAAGNNVFTLGGFIDAPEVYDAAVGLPTPPVTTLPAVINIAPVITNFTATLSGSVDTPIVILRWDAQNADYFIVQMSSDGGASWVTISQRLLENTLNHAALIGAIRYRVAGVNLMQGQWAAVVINTEDPSFNLPPAPTELELTEAFTGPVLRIQWEGEHLAYRIGFYDGATEKYAVQITSEVGLVQYELLASVARAHGLGRSFTVKVWSISQYGKLSATSANLAVSNPLPGVPSGLQVTQSLGSVFVKYNWPTDSDLDGISVWVSVLDGFAPDQNTLVVDRFKASSISFEMSSSQNIYIRVAALDVWGNDFVASSQFVLAFGDYFDRLEGELLASHLHHTLSDRINLIDAPSTGLVAQSLTNANNIINEASARLSLAQQLRGDYSGSALDGVTTGLLRQEVVAREASINQLSSQMALLTAGSATQFDHVEIWYFDAGVEGWVGVGADPVVTNPGWLRPSSTATDPRLTSPTGLVIDGTKYPQIRARIKKIGSPVWLGEFRWVTTDSAAFDTTKRVFIAEPTFDSAGVALVTLDITSINWVGKTVTRIRLQLPNTISGTDLYEIDWIAIGRPSPGASSAELFTEQQARIDGDNSLSSSITAANAAIAGKASQSSVDTLSGRVTTAENTITSQGNKLTALASQLGTNSILPNPDFAVWDNGLYYPDGWAAWDSSGVSKYSGVHSADNAIQMVCDTTNNSGVQVFRNDVINAQFLDLEIVFTLVSGGLSGAGILVDWVTTTTQYRVAFALNSLYVATDVVGKRIIGKFRAQRPLSFTGTFTGMRVYLLGNYNGNGLGALATKTIIFDRCHLSSSDASASAIQSLDSRVTAAEGNASSQSSQITALNNALDLQEKIRWTKDYAVSASVTLAILYHDNAALPTTTAAGAGPRSEYIATAVTVSTGTVTKTIARFYFDGTAWQVEQLSNLGQTSNHPILLISSGVPSVRTNHENLYSVRVTMEDARLAGGYGSANSQAISSLSSTVISQGSQLTTQSSAITALTNSLSTTDANVSTAQTTANNAQAAATAANNLLADIASDSKLTPSEKQSVRVEWNTIAAEKAGINSQATTFSITTENTTYNNAFQTLANYLNNGTTWSSGVPSWIADANLSTTTNIVGSTFRANWSSYYTSRTALLNRIALKAKELADAAQSSANTKAESSALSALSSTVSSQGSTITSQGSAITTLQSDVAGKASAAALTTLTTRVTNVEGVNTSQASAISTLQTNVSNNAAAISTEASVRAGETGPLMAQWSVKTNVNDLVGGVGLYNDGTKTYFMVHADIFSVYSPGKQAFGLVLDGDQLVVDKIKVGAVSNATSSDFTSVVSSQASASTHFLDVTLGSFNSAGANPLISASIQVKADNISSSVDRVVMQISLTYGGFATTAIARTTVPVIIDGTRQAIATVPLLYKVPNAYGGNTSGTKSLQIRARLYYYASNGVFQSTAVDMSVFANWAIEENKV